MLFPHPQADQIFQTGQRRGARARRYQSDLADVLAGQPQSVQHRRADDDRRAVLVVMKNGDTHPLAERLFHLEAIRRLDVFQIDPAEGRLQGGDGFDESIGVGLRQFEIENIDTSEFLIRVGVTQLRVMCKVD